MPTTNTSIVAPSGGDYTSLSAWEAGEQRNLVTGDQIEVAEIQGDWSGGADTTELVIDGWTTDSTRYIEIRTDAANRHAGIWDDGLYRLTASSAVNGETIRIVEHAVRVIGLQVSAQATGSNYFEPFNFDLDSSAVRGYCEDCIMRSINGGTGSLLFSRNGVVRISNTLFYGDDEPTLYGIYIGAGTAHIHNVTIVDAVTGVHRAGTSTVNCKNVGISGATTAFSGTISQTTCSSSTPTFVNAASKDFHLASGDTTWKDAGTDLSADADYAISTDIDGATRTGTWDIGADEVTGGGGTAWTLEIADSISLADAPTKAMDIAKAETLALADTAAKQAGLSRSESVALVDSLSRGFNVALTDSIAVEDNLANSIVLGALVDSLGLSDSAQTAIVLVLELADTLTVADARTLEAQLTKSDEVTLADAAAKAVTLALLVESLSLTDSQTSGLVLLLELADTLNLTDTGTRELSKVVADTVGLVDSAFRAVSIEKGDALTLGDVLAAVRGLNLAVSDSLTLGDSTLTQILGVAAAVNLWRAQLRSREFRAVPRSTEWRAR